MYAALSAPAEVPTRRSGEIPRSISACSIPTWTAPTLAPPDSTKAVVTSASELVRELGDYAAAEHVGHLRHVRLGQVVLRHCSLEVAAEHCARIADRLG